MLNRNQMTFVHALIVLPDERILLRRQLCFGNTNSKWTATIERAIFETDTPSYEANQAVLKGLKLNLTLFSNKIIHCIPKATIEPLNSIAIPNHNRVVFPFVVRIKGMVTLQSETNYEFAAKSFSELSEDIMCNTIYRHNAAEGKHTTNTVHVMKEAHLKDVLKYAPRR